MSKLIDLIAKSYENALLDKNTLIVSKRGKVLISAFNKPEDKPLLTTITNYITINEG